MVFLRSVIKTSFLKLWYYGPGLIPCSEVILKLGQKRSKFVHLALLISKGQNP